MPFHESDPDRWWENASQPVRALYAVLRETPPGAAPALPPLADPATAPGHRRRLRRRGAVAAGREHRRGARRGAAAHRGRPVVDLAGQVAVVTGGTRGIGVTIAADLARAGAQVSVWSRRPPPGIPGPRRSRATSPTRPPWSGRDRPGGGRAGADRPARQQRRAGRRLGAVRRGAARGVVARLRGEPARRRAPHRAIVLARHGRARPRPRRVDVERHGERAEPVLRGVRVVQVRAGRADGADRGRGRRRTASAPSRWRPAW